MFSNSVDDAIWKSTLENSQFIRNVSEEDRRNRILDDAFMRSTAQNPYHKRVQSNISLCSALKNVKDEKFVNARQELMRQLENEELRQLHAYLRAAATAKINAALQFEREALKNEEKTRKHYESLHLRNARLSEAEFYEEHENIKRQKQNAFKNDLDMQVKEKEEKRKLEKLAKLEDKIRMDEVIRRHEEEILKEAHEAEARKKKLLEETQEFNKSRQEWAALKSKLQQEAEERKKEHFKSMQQQPSINYAFHHEIKDDKKEKIECRLKLSDQIGIEIHKANSERIKFTEFLTDLLVGERQAKEEMKAHQEELKKMQYREATRLELIRFNEEKYNRKQETKRLKEQERREQINMLNEYKRQEQNLINRKNAKIAEYRQAISETLNEKRRLKTIEMKRHMLSHMNEVKNAENKAKFIEEARMKLIREHAPKVLEYLPPKALRPSDWKHLTVL